MRKTFAAAVLLLTAACASMRSDSGLGRAKVHLADPEILIRQISTLPFAARHVSGSIPVQYHVSVGNRATEPITLKQVSIVSMGYGAYEVEQTSRPFNTLIQPDGAGQIEFWVPARIDDPSIIGANGPVTLRLALQFDSPKGQFQHIVTQQVNAMPGRR
jgi:hypothetical protein